MQIKIKYEIGQAVYTVGKAIDMLKQQEIYVMSKNIIKDVNFINGKIIYLIAYQTGEKEIVVAVPEESCFLGKDKALEEIGKISSEFINKVETEQKRITANLIESFKNFSEEASKKIMEE